MDISKTTLMPYEDAAIDAVVTILNEAKWRTGTRLNLSQLANSRNEFVRKSKLSLNQLRNPLVVNCEKFIEDAIVFRWQLSQIFQYHLRYIGSSSDETAQFLYYEAVFSQPTPSYPIPQATVSVFFTVDDRHEELTASGDVPEITFRMEGQTKDHDVRSVLLTPDWILATLKMKINLFNRIESLNLF